MNCKDFRDIADSYLSNELLVETNHDLLRHLESCVGCRNLLSSRREMREQLRTSVKSADISLISQAFAVRLRSRLRQQAFGRQRAVAGLKLAFAGMAAVLLLTVGAVILRQRSEQPVQANLNPAVTIPANSAVTNDPPQYFRAAYIAARNDAIDDHKNCALTKNLEQHPISLSEAAKKFDKVNAGLDTTILKTLREKFGNDAKFIDAHYCLINGRYFSHIILKYKGRVVSVLMTKLDTGGLHEGDAISCKSDEGVETACFEIGGYGIFVVSDLPESDNMTIARTIAEPIGDHIVKSRV